MTHHKDHSGDSAPPNAVVPLGDRSYGGDYPAPPADELSIADLVLALRRRWRIIAVVTAACTGLALAAALLLPAKYAYTAVAQVGQMPDTEQNNDRMTAPLEEPAGVVAQLENAWVPQAIRAELADRGEKAGEDLPTPEIEVGSPEGSRTIRLEAETSEQYGGFYTAILNRALQSLRDAHQPLYDNERSKYEARLEKARLKLDKLQNETLFGLKIEQQQNQIDDAQRHLASLRSQQKVIETRLDKLDTRKALLEDRQERLEGYIDNASRQQKTATSGATSPTQAMSLMVLGNQLQSLRDRLATTEQRLQVKLPDQRESLHKNLADNQRAQQETKTRISRLKNELEGIRIRHDNAIANAKQDVRRLQSRLDSVMPTRVLAEPFRSIEPVGIPKAVLVVLGLVLGLGGGVVLALLVDAVARPASRDAAGYPVAAGANMNVTGGIDAPEQWSRAGP